MMSSSESFPKSSLKYIDSLETSGSFDGFSDALIIWINKPHVVNRRLCGSRIKFHKSFRKDTTHKPNLTEILAGYGYKIPDVGELGVTFGKKSDQTCSDDAGSDLSCGNDYQFTPVSVCNNVGDLNTITINHNKPNVQQNCEHDCNNSGNGNDTWNSNCDKTNKLTNSIKTERDHEETNLTELYSKIRGHTGEICHNASGVNNTTNVHQTFHVHTVPDVHDRRNIVHDGTDVQGTTHFGDNVHEITGLFHTQGDNVAIVLREHLPKQPERHRNMPEMIVFDKNKQSCTFYPLFSPGFSNTDHFEVVYEFRFLSDEQSRIELHVSNTDQTRDSDRKLSLTWLKDILLKKLINWCETPNLKISLTSLVLVPVDEYSKLYSELKNKYGLHFAKIWPENTDPQKFVFEDVSIATYLLLLWQQDRQRKGLTHKQSFVDLGCGNGLLVHILASEGHPGFGVDIRRRKIWDLYGPETVLKESTVIPSSDCLFPDSDWLIGNHSDELTPWIPLMAARSSYTCNYFVLPCCHYDFKSKFSYDPEYGRGTDGQYQCYLNFVRHVGEQCGFNVEEDVLRIPSTKRVCFIGRTRSYDQSCENEMDQSRQAFLARRCGSVSAFDSNNDDSSCNSCDKWIQDFTPREKIETVKNCVSVSETVKNKVVEVVFNKILESDSCEVRTGHDGKPWRKGGHIKIGEVCDLFDKVTLSELKNECGGLQTLLRNSSQIFQVSSGQVQLRDFTEEDPFAGRKRKGRSSNKADLYKTSLCWFFINHPDGCPKSAETCMYAHGKVELREKPTRINKLQ